MARGRTSSISSRKEPQQARSTRLVQDVLSAAVRVLAKEGAQRFTMARVAKKAGVSVGSLYQYFPNKAAILFRLQRDEWRETTETMRTILGNDATPPLARLRTLVHAFIRSECEEAEIRIALADAAPLYRDAPETKAAMAEGDRIVARFMREVLPQASKAKRDLAGDVITTTLSEVGKHLSEDAATRAATEAYGDALADMFSAYLMSLR
jgi:AcrR family transcriptional regulator